MKRRHGDTLTMAQIIRAALPRNAAKHITRGLGCSDRQGRTIAAGKAPSRLLSALRVLLEAEIARTKKKIEEAEHALREIEAADAAGAAALETARCAMVPASPAE